MPKSRRMPVAVLLVVLPAGSLALALAVRPAVAAPSTVVSIQAPVDTPVVTEATIAEGRKIFHGQGTCFGCHGANLEGGPIAPTLTAHAWKDAKGGELSAIYYVVTHGVSGTAMVSHPGGITDAEAAEVAAYVWAVSHGKTKP